MNTNVENWLNEFVGVYKEKVHLKKLEFKVALDAHPKVLDIEPNLLTQCIGSLMDNAVEFTNAGRIDLSVRMRNQPADGAKKMLVITVKDTGIGLSKSDLKRVFVPFKPGADKTNQPGKYPGLLIAEAIAHSRGGSIAVKSHIGLGSTFTFTVPVQEAFGVSAPSEPEVILEAPPRPLDMEILIVEDDASLRARVADVLIDVAFSLETSNSHDDALRRVESGKYKFIFVGTQVQGLDAYAFANQCKKLQPGAYIVALVSGVDKFRSTSQAKPFDDILDKDHTREDLLFVIDTGANRPHLQGK